MDIDDNDLLFTNQYIPQPNLEGEVSDEFNEEFKKYYKKTQQQKEAERASIRSIQKSQKSDLDEETDVNNLLTTNSFTNSQIQNVNNQTRGVNHRSVKEVVTYVSVDSRDRDKTLYLKPNNFKIFLGKTFHNVKRIRLASIEFPNTNAVINSSNNRIYWRNKEDIDNDIVDSVTKTYPVYSVQLRIGSYIASTLSTEMKNKLDLVKRRNKVGDYHYFTVDLDLDTDIVTFTSLTLSQLGNNPFSATKGTGIITVSHNSHGYSTGDSIYLIGTKTFVGIPSATLGGKQTITVLNPNSYQYEVNVKAGDTGTGGGNTVKAGKEAPFQLLFGENSNTVAQNIGFPLENSSTRIDMNIKSMQNVSMVEITLQTIHTFTNSYEFIGQTCDITGSGTIPNMDGTRAIAKIVNSTTLLVIITNKIDFETFNSGTLTFNGVAYNISTISNYTDTLLLTTYTEHNYTFTDIGSSITLYNTVSTPSFDGSNTIDTLLSNTQIVLLGNVLERVTSTVVGDSGSIPFHNPLTTFTFNITDIIPGTITTFVCPGHGLNAGDTVKFYNVYTAPSVLNKNSGVFTILSVPDSNSFTIDFQTTSFTADTITNGTAYIGVQVVQVTMPSHGFNKVISISNGYTPVIATSILNDTDYINYIYKAIIITSTPHRLADGTNVTIVGSNCTPTIDGNYTMTLIDNTSFEVTLPFDLTANGTNATITLAAMTANVTTLLPHGLSDGSKVRIMQTNSIPSLDSALSNNGAYVATVLSPTTFQITFGRTLQTPGTSGIIGMNHNFYLYSAVDVGGITSSILNGAKYTVRDIIDANQFTFNAGDYSSKAESGGGDNVYISSLFHGFSGVQQNTKNSLLNRSINLEGENYAFLCCPQLGTMMNTGDVTNIFGRITLDQSPGSMVFAFLSNPKEFDTVPLDKLSELEFSVVNHNGSLYEFSDLDFGFCLEITEVVDYTESFNYSSRRGVNM